MPLIYYYTGFDRYGKYVKGYTTSYIDEVDKDIIIVTLKIVKITSPKKLLEQINFFTYLSQFIRSDRLIINALYSIVTSGVHYIPWLLSVIENIKSGASFSKAICKTYHTFDKITLSIISIGEEAGLFQESCILVVEYLRKKYKLQSIIKEQTRYPLIVLLILCILSMVFIFILLPEIAEIQTHMKNQITWYIYKNPHIVFSYIFISFILLRAFVRRYAAFMEHVLLYIPLVNTIIINSALSEMFYYLFFLDKSNLKGLVALEIVNKNISCSFLQISLVQSIDSIKRGKAFTLALASIKYMHVEYKLLLQSVTSTHDMKDIYSNIIDQIEQRQNEAFSILSHYMQPAMMVILGILIVVAYYIMLAPMYYIDII